MCVMIEIVAVTKTNLYERCIFDMPYTAEIKTTVASRLKINAFSGDSKKNGANSNMAINETNSGKKRF